MSLTFSLSFPPLLRRFCFSLPATAPFSRALSLSRRGFSSLPPLHALASARSLDGTLLYATGFPHDSNYNKPNSIYLNYLGCPAGQGLQADEDNGGGQGAVGFSQGRCQDCEIGSFNNKADLSNCSSTRSVSASFFPCCQASRQAIVLTFSPCRMPHHRHHDCVRWLGQQRRLQGLRQGLL